MLEVEHAVRSISFYNKLHYSFYRNVEKSRTLEIIFRMQIAVLSVPDKIQRSWLDKQC